MEEKKLDPEMIREILDWLNRSIGNEENSNEPDVPCEWILTEPDREFLRIYGIAVS